MGGKLSYGRITWANYPSKNTLIESLKIEPPEPQKCKCCGAPLTRHNDKITCEYCGTIYE